MKIIRFLDLDQLNYCQGNIKIEQVLENLGKVIISYDSIKDRVLAPARENETENDREKLKCYGKVCCEQIRRRCNPDEYIDFWALYE